jgi:hypothetical protein
VLDEVLAVERTDMRLGVADVDREQHGADYSLSGSIIVTR